MLVRALFYSSALLRNLQTLTHQAEHTQEYLARTLHLLSPNSLCQTVICPSFEHVSVHRRWCTAG